MDQKERLVPLATLDTMDRLGMDRTEIESPNEERKCGARAYARAMFYECELPMGHQGPHESHHTTDADGDQYVPISLTVSVTWQPRKK